jgi:hypothetical protein
MLAAADEIERLRAERDEVRREADRLACRNAVLVAEVDAYIAQMVRLRQNVETSLRRALYEGEG